MITIIAKWTVLAFGSILILAGFLMLFAPKKAGHLLSMAGSTNLINYGEISIRMIPAAALVIIADGSRSPLFFAALGWFMLATSVVLFMIPRSVHHNFSLKCAAIIRPYHFQLIAPLSFLFGATLIYCIL